MSAHVRCPECGSQRWHKDGRHRSQLLPGNATIRHKICVDCEKPYETLEVPVVSEAGAHLTRQLAPAWEEYEAMKALRRRYPTGMRKPSPKREPVPAGSGTP